jgi:hypothetical protein
MFEAYSSVQHLIKIVSCQIDGLRIGCKSESKGDGMFWWCLTL